jgi:hypothetical protein
LRVAVKPKRATKCQKQVRELAALVGSNEKLAEEFRNITEEFKKKHPKHKYSKVTRQHVWAWQNTCTGIPPHFTGMAAIISTRHGKPKTAYDFRPDIPDLDNDNQPEGTENEEDKPLSIT